MNRHWFDSWLSFSLYQSGKAKPIKTILVQVATAHLVAGSTLTFWILWQTPFASASSYSSIVQSSRLLVQLQEANLHLVPINAHVMWWSRHSIDQVRASHGSQNEDKELLQPSQRYHKGEFWHVSISAQQRSLRCGQNLRAFPESYTANDSCFMRSSDGGQQGRQKGS